jgi:hypothetical protein
MARAALYDNIARAKDPRVCVQEQLKATRQDDDEVQGRRGMAAVRESRLPCEEATIESVIRGSIGWLVVRSGFYGTVETGRYLPHNREDQSCVAARLPSRRGRDGLFGSDH